MSRVGRQRANAVEAASQIRPVIVMVPKTLMHSLFAAKTLASWP
jgi:hypothetical protein